jgi:hypothetical protein
MLKQIKHNFFRKNNKVVAFSLLVVLTLVFLPLSYASASPSASFSATDLGVCGNGQSWYTATCGSPVVNVSSDTTEIVYYLNGSQVGTNTKAGGFSGYAVSASTLANGVYHLSATVYNGSGQTGTVMATDGNSYLTFTVANAPTAKFDATDLGVCGNAESSYDTTCGSGITDVSSDATQIVYYLNGAEVAVDNQSEINNGYAVAASTLANGVYHLTGTVQDVDGDIGPIYAEDGNASLTFTVDNTTAPSTSDQTCNSKQQDLNTITTRIVNRSESQLQTIDSVAKAVEAYYSKQTQKLPGYSAAVAQLTSDENTTQVGITNMVADSVINCGGDLQSQLTQFSGSVSSVQTDMSTYIQNVQSLISQLENLS